MKNSTRDVLFEIAKEIGLIFEDIENQILQELAHAFDGVDDPDVLEKELNRIKLKFINKCKKRLEDADQKIKNKIAEALVNMEKYTIQDVLEFLGKNLDKSKLVQALVDRNYKHVKKAFKMLLARSAVVQSGMLTNAQNAIGQAINEIVLRIKNGEVYATSLQKGLNKVADTGFKFVDKSGKIGDPRTYMDMASRTQAKNVSKSVNQETAKEVDNDLYIINILNDGCDVCAVWEGRVISMNGKTEGYPTLDEAEADGYSHPNCRHTEVIYIENVTKPAKQNREEAQKNYMNTQKQRFMERQIRNWRKRSSVAVDEQTKKFTADKIKAWQKTLNNFTKENDMPRFRGREVLNIPVDNDGKMEFDYLFKGEGEKNLFDKIK